MEHGAVMPAHEMEGDYSDLLQLQHDFSEEVFSAWWFDRLEDVIRKLLRGYQWNDENYGFDTNCCYPHHPHQLGRMMYLIGKLGGFWVWNTSGGYRWDALQTPVPVR